MHIWASPVFQPHLTCAQHFKVCTALSCPSSCQAVLSEVSAVFSGGASGSGAGGPCLWGVTAGRQGAGPGVWSLVGDGGRPRAQWCPSPWCLSWRRLGTRTVCRLPQGMAWTSKEPGQGLQDSWPWRGVRFTLRTSRVTRSKERSGRGDRARSAVRPS